MNRPFHIWLVFAACAFVLVGATTWMTATALRLEQAQADAQRAAEFEEKVRLALWRMDSLLTPIIVEETARPASHYQAAPLLNYLPAHAYLYFELNPRGEVRSPNVPASKLAGARASSPTQAMDVATVRLAQLKLLLAAPGGASGFADNRDLFSNVVAGAAGNVAAQTSTNALPAGDTPGQVLFGNYNPAQVREQNQLVQSLRNSAEYQARANVFQQAQAGRSASASEPTPAAPEIFRGAPGEGPMIPVWLGPALVLARQVRAVDGDSIQGVWLNWIGLHDRLVESVRDLFPRAELRAASASGPAGRRLAALPVEFVPGPTTDRGVPSWSSARLTLAFAWACMFLAVVAVAVLLFGAVSLSERRGAFVSAVTHELRTPLTTFKMYSEMLADDMVRDETKRKHYLQTLCSEANRLTHLVENVLAYARLERGSARRRVERVTLGELIDRTRARLEQRAEQAEMQLVVEADERARATVVQVDVAAVEQILFNLVDNACKYAAPSATERIIHLEAHPDARFAMLRVRDHGRGISDDGARRLFQPFGKSADDAAHTAPGIGLGLALCRRLSRSLGGDLRFNRTVNPGACFELLLPRHP